MGWVSVEEEGGGEVLGAGQGECGVVVCGGELGEGSWGDIDSGKSIDLA